MPTARYLRISIFPQVNQEDIQLSGFKLYRDDTLIDLSTAVITSNFTSTIGNLSFLKRTNIVNGEHLGIAKNNVRNGFIYIDLGSSIEFNAFSFGSGSSKENSLLKFILSTSADSIVYENWEFVYKELILKYITPYTFSNLTLSNTAYPSFILPDTFTRTLLIDTSYSGVNSISVDVKKRRVYNKINSDKLALVDGNNNNGEIFFSNISSVLSRNKFYFEVSSESGVNLNNNYFSTALMLNFDLARTISTINNNYSSMPFFSFTNAYNYSYTDPYTNHYSSGAGYTLPERLPALVGPKEGFLMGFSIDLINNVVNIVNSPYDNRTLKLNNTTFTQQLNARALENRLTFTMFSPGRNGSLMSDLTFNFGQLPFNGPVPEGFDGRIGQRWEMEYDELYIKKDKTSIYSYDCTALKNVSYLQVDQLETDVEDLTKNFCIAPELKFYIKGNIRAINNTFKKKFVRLLTYPEMTQYRDTVSRIEDGLYEFINIENRAYVVVSMDTVSDEYEPEIIAPVYPKKMETNL